MEIEEEEDMVVNAMVDDNDNDDESVYLASNKHEYQLGEKGHKEHAWEKSTNIRELLLQLNFQLVREPCENKVIFLENIQRKILDELMTKLEHGSIGFLEYEELVTLNYKLVAYTRDIISGKGEYTLSYMLINVWYEFFPELAKFMLRSFLLHPYDNNTHPFGSWKDVKYFCNYCIHCGYSHQYPLIKYAFQLLIEQLKIDVLKTKDTDLSLVSKWIPREKSKRFGWIFKELSQLYFEKYLQSTNDVSMIKAKLKCKTDFRKLIAGLNKRLGTIQINQCSKNWSKIDCKNITSITLSKQSKALLNLNQAGKTRYALYDRIQCSNHIIMHIYGANLKNGSAVKGKRTSVADFVKRAIDMIQNENENENENQNECDLLNMQWNDLLSQIEPLGPMIPLVDTSETMNGEPLYNAIGMACIIAQKSTINRIITFSATSKWHNLEHCGNLVDIVRHLLINSNRGMNANFYDALDKILSVFMEENFTREIANGMTLVVLSDMQIDSCFNKGEDDHDHEAEDEAEDEDEDEMGSFYDRIEQKYKDANCHYKPPHILFWNLRNTNGFPTHSTKYNASMISGYQPHILNSYVKRGNLSQNTCNPWFMFSKQLNISRYKFLEEKVSSVLNE